MFPSGHQWVIIIGWCLCFLCVHCKNDSEDEEMIKQRANCKIVSGECITANNDKTPEDAMWSVCGIEKQN